MIDKNRLQNEKELIYQLLHDKNAIDKFYDFGLKKNHFSDEHKDIVSFILKAYDDDNILSIVINNFKKNKSTGYTGAIKKLLDEFEDVLEDTASQQPGELYYDDIRNLSKERIQYIEDVRSGKVVEEPLILSGIKEMDYTMVNGFEKGTLTLICADVGAFKSSMMLNIGLNVW